MPKVVYAGMMQYDGDEQIPELYLVKPPAIDKTLSEYLATNGVFQIACSKLKNTATSPISGMAINPATSTNRKKSTWKSHRTPCHLSNARG